MRHRRKLPALVMIFSLAVFLVSSALMLAKAEPFYTWFYLFAWWPYILFIESLLRFHGRRSMLYDTPGQFLKLLPLSVTIWLVFEAVNFRLENWHYLNLPANTGLRWFGYAASYATVLPAVFCTASAIRQYRLIRLGPVKRLRRPERLYVPFMFTGTACLFLPVALPQFFFALIWGAFIFLLEPVNHALGGKSLLADWESGTMEKFVVLLAAGAWCGFLWELWNFWAAGKWYYTVPLVGEIKLFEMPVLGFLGFPPFAVECFVMTSAYFLFDERLAGLSPARRNLARLAVYTGMIVFACLVFSGIDRFTVDTLVFYSR